MEPTIFKASPPSLLKIKDETRFFPVHHVYCIGRNYREHSLEMGHDPEREAPFFFQKNPDNLDQTGIFHYPRLEKKCAELSSSIHHEVELMVALKAGGSFLDIKMAKTLIFGFGIALDLTKRDLQTTLKKQGRPWEISKAFAHSAPCSILTPIEQTGMLFEGEICLEINGQLKQQGNLRDMIWKIPEIIATLSCYFPLRGGDIILTGTPKGVGPIHIGDKLSAHIEKLPPFCLEIQ